jgi:hypothetical protein
LLPATRLLARFSSGRLFTYVPAGASNIRLLAVRLTFLKVKSSPETKYNFLFSEGERRKMAVKWLGGTWLARDVVYPEIHTSLYGK